MTAQHERTTRSIDPWTTGGKLILMRQGLDVLVAAKASTNAQALYIRLVLASRWKPWGGGPRAWGVRMKSETIAAQMAVSERHYHRARPELIAAGVLHYEQGHAHRASLFVIRLPCHGCHTKQVPNHDAGVTQGAALGDTGVRHWVTPASPHSSPEASPIQQQQQELARAPEIPPMNANRAAAAAADLPLWEHKTAGENTVFDPGPGAYLPPTGLEREWEALEELGIGTSTRGQLCRSGLTTQEIQAVGAVWKRKNKSIGILVLDLRDAAMAKVTRARRRERRRTLIEWFNAMSIERRHELCAMYRDTGKGRGMTDADVMRTDAWEHWLWDRYQDTLGAAARGSIRVPDFGAE